MFNCYVHMWSHIEKPCPLCHPVHTYTTSSSEIIIPLQEKEKPMDLYQGLNEEDLKRLRKADVLYIAQLIEDNEKLKNKLEDSENLLREVHACKTIRKSGSPVWTRLAKYLLGKGTHE